MALNHHPFTLVEAIMPSSVARLVVEEVIASGDC
jgi:hypothetical protein